MPLIEIWKKDDAYLWDGTRGPDHPQVKEWVARGNCRLAQITDEQWQALLSDESDLDLKALWDSAGEKERR